jgi:hypothetical protein
MPCAKEECKILLVEPNRLVNTGEAGCEPIAKNVIAGGGAK